ncbi:MAG: hypothetical protein MUF84_13345, partial [Anaerolineae bacterium]|nr:hypothetical protein [Anaerolineae bacterium]
MILGDRRAAVITICLSGLESAALAPLLVWGYAKPGIAVLWVTLGLWAVQCLWTIIVDVLNSMNLDDAAFKWRVIGAMLSSSVLLVRAVAYARVPIGDLSWLAATWSAILSFDDGISLELLTVLTNIVLWQRAMAQSGSHMPFAHLSRTIRLLWMVTALAAAAASRIAGTRPMSVLIGSFPLGLFVLLMARADEKESNTASIGPAPSLSVMTAGSLQLVLLVGVVSAVGVLLPLATLDLISPWVERGFSFILLLALQTVMLIVFLIYPLVMQAVSWA